MQVWMHRIGSRSVSKAHYLWMDDALLQSLIWHQSEMDVWEVRPLESNNIIDYVNISSYFNELIYN
jgi:hypothetical protein